MDYRFRIEGIYDKKTLHLLETSKIREFTFDFRPRSFNFIQIHAFKELLNTGILFQNLYLQFRNEKEFVIEEIVKEIPQELKSRCFLEIAGVLDFRSLPLPFYWQFDLDRDWKSVLQEPSLKGIVFPYALLSQLQDQNIFLEFFKQFYEELNRAGRADIELVLALDWDSDIFPSLFDFVQFNVLSLPINSKIELAYRQLDESKFSHNFKEFRQNIGP